MKKLKNSSIVLILLLLTASSCKKDTTLYQLFFFTNLQGQSGQLDLYINDNFSGKLPYVNHDGINFPDTLLPKTLNIGLKAGTYTLKGKDLNNDLKSNSTIQISSSKISISGTMGGDALTVRSNSIVVNLFF